MKNNILAMAAALSILFTVFVPLTTGAEELGTLDFYDDFSTTDLANWDAPTGKYRVFEVVDGRMNAKENSDNESAARIKNKIYDDFSLTFNFKTDYSINASYLKVELWDSATNINDWIIFRTDRITHYNGSTETTLANYSIASNTEYDVMIKASQEAEVYIKRHDEVDYTYIGTTSGLRIPSSRYIVFGQKDLKISIDDVCVYTNKPDEPDEPNIPDEPDPDNGGWKLDFEDDFSLTDLANWDAPTGKYRVFEVVDGRMNARATSDNESAARIKGKVYDDFLLTFNIKTNYAANAYFKVELWDSTTNLNDWLIFRADRITHYNGNSESVLSNYTIENDTLYDVKIQTGSEASVYIKKHDEANYTYIGTTNGLRIPSSRYIVFGQKDLKISVDDVNVYTPVVSEFVGSSPSDGDVEVDTMTTVELNFSNSMDASTINPSTVVVTGGHNVLEYTVNRISDTQYSIVFKEPLEYMTEYTISMGDGIKDIGNNAITDAEFSFTTDAANEWNLQFSDDFSETDLANWDAPSGRYRVFEVVDGRMNAREESDNSSAARIKGLTWNGFQLEFNILTKYTSNEYFKVELWDEQNNSDWLIFRNDRITYYNGQSEALIGNYRINSDTVYDVKVIALGSTASIYIKPHTEKGYTFVGTSQNMKITENRYIVFGQTNLKISIDDVKVSTMSAPEIILYYPENKSQDVVVDTEIYLCFSKNMDADTINPDTVVINDGNENVQFTVTEVSGTEFSLKPTDELDYFANYTVNITDGVKDKYGQSITGTAFSFMTQEQPPEIDVIDSSFAIIRDGESIPVTKLENGTIRGTFSVKNNTDEERKLAVIAAVYRAAPDGTKIMEDIVIQEVSLDVSDNIQQIFAEIDVPNTNGRSVGLFLWDGVDTMTPIAPCAELN